MLINLPEDIARKLEQLAQQQGASVAELLDDLLKRYAQDSAGATLADLARNAQQAGLTSTQSVDTAAKSREILNTELADYLKRRMADGDHRG